MSCFGGKMIWRKCSLGRESGGVPLLKHVYSSVFTGRQEISLCHYFKLQLGIFLGGKLSTSTLNLDFHVRKHNRNFYRLAVLQLAKAFVAETCSSCLITCYVHCSQVFSLIHRGCKSRNEAHRVWS